MVEVTIEKLVGLTGDLEDNMSSSENFRSFISEESVTVADLEDWTSECLDKTGTNFHRALQDIMNHGGQRLGFEVDFGVYRGETGRIGYDGLWTSKEAKVRIVVDTKKSTTYQIKPEQLGRYIKELKTQDENKEYEYYGLFVIGGENLGTVANTIRGSEYRNSIRIMPCKSVLTLLNIMKDGKLSHEQIVKLLLPIDAVNVGEMIELIDSIVTARVGEEIEEEMSEHEFTEAPTDISGDPFDAPRRGKTGITQWAYADMIMILLRESNGEEMTRHMFSQIRNRAKLLQIDRDKVPSGIPRYRATAGWAIQRLKHRGYIESAGYGKWRLTKKGVARAEELP